jgi:glycerophosphoryl diester phosphodiesterase
VKIAGHLGNQAHAPANSMLALTSAYVGGADILHCVVRLCGSDRLVLARDADTAPQTGIGGKVAALNVSELRKLNYAREFAPRGAEPGDAPFSYIDTNVDDRRFPIDVFDEIIDALPHEAQWCIELRGDPDIPGRDAEAAEALAALLQPRRLAARVILTADSDALLEALRQAIPDGRLAVRPGLHRAGSGAFVLCDAAALWSDGSFTAAATALRAEVEQGIWREGAYVVVDGPVAPDFLTAAAAAEWIGVVAAPSLFDCAAARASYVVVSEAFAGKAPNKASYSLGYAKANHYARVSWDDGVHVDIDEYDGDQPAFGGDEVHRQLARLRWRLIDVAREWPFYSGGGVGLTRGISGDFAAEVDYRVDRVGQATTLEMAVVNVDPGAHRDSPPESFRDKDSFFDPHGAPPYVGVEHDEDDGYRINWNLGAEYDNNQYGRPAGDGRTPRSARLRLERRGHHFAAYYKGPADQAGRSLQPRDWVCVGVAHNESLNRTVYLRCVGKRWRQEKASDPDQFEPIIANRFTFRNLLVRRFPSDTGD